MQLKPLFFGFLFSLTAVSYAQKSNKEVLFTIDQKPYYTEEFKRVYNKNIDLVKEESQKDLDQYLELFIGFKLKTNKGLQLGLQNGTNYQNELKSYRAQLSKNYTTDSKVTKELVEEAYNRSLKEIKAAHILLHVDENASAEDTLKVYNSVLEIRQKAINGEDFGQLALTHSQDPSAKENKGDLGYFSTFRMLYPFETAAYNTPKGSVSKPVRTRFGYHLIKVEDIRDNRGEVAVAHIMIMNPTAKEGTKNHEQHKTTIEEIYKKIQQGENFEELAKQFSEDKSSAPKGGVLNRFGSGQLSAEEFENTAFALTSEKPISAPFQTKFGWHIVKLIEKFPAKTFEEAKAEIEGKISKDDRSRLITASMTEKLRAKYPVKRNDKGYVVAAKQVTDAFYEGKWEIPTTYKELDKKLVSIDNKTLTVSDFFNYLKPQQKKTNNIKPTTKLVDHYYEKFVDNELNNYYNANLEKEFPEFAAVMDEYRDGLLLFDLMEKEIWEKSKTDTLGLKKYYDANSNNYQWKSRMDLTLLSSTNLAVIKKAHQLMKQNKTPEFIKEQLNSKEGTLQIMTKVGVFETDNEALPKSIKPALGLSEIIKEGNYYFIANIKSLLPAGPKTLEESKGRVINDYQQYLEANWVKELKKEFKVEVNQPAFEKVKKDLKV